VDLVIRKTWYHWWSIYHFEWISVNIICIAWVNCNCLYVQRSHTGIRGCPYLVGLRTWQNWSIVCTSYYIYRDIILNTQNSRRISDWVVIWNCNSGNISLDICRGLRSINNYFVQYWTITEKTWCWRKANRNSMRIASVLICEACYANLKTLIYFNRVRRSIRTKNWSVIARDISHLETLANWFMEDNQHFMNRYPLKSKLSYRFIHCLRSFENSKRSKDLWH